MALPATTSLADTMALLKGAKNQFGRNAGRPATLKEGKTKVRVLQIPGQPQFFREVGQHWIKPDEKAKAVAVCGSITVTYADKTDAEGNPLPDTVFDAVEKAIMQASTDDEVKLYKSWRPRKFVLVNALILEGADAGPDPRILQLSGGAFADFLAIAETYGESGVNVFDPDTGIDVIFERRGKMLDTEYTVMAAPVSKKFDPALLGKAHDLDAYIAKEYFRQGEDRKALTAIQSISGISVGAAAASSGALAIAPPRTGALTGSAAKLAELSSPTPPAAPAAPAAPVAPAAPAAPAVVEEDEDERAMRELQAKMAAKAAAKAAAAQAPAAPAAPAPTPAAPAAPADDFGSAIDADDLAATLAELDNL